MADTEGWTGVSTAQDGDRNLGRRSEYIHVVIAIITESELRGGWLMTVGRCGSLLFCLTSCGFMTWFIRLIILSNITFQSGHIKTHDTWVHP